MAQQLNAGAARTADTAAVKIDTSLIPKEAADNLADATLTLILGILQQPGGREELDRRTAARKAAEVRKE